jgi:diaminopimelate epimerase
VTEACGTGACAAAHVAHDRGLVGSRVKVAMPGGVVEVVLGDTIQLVGFVSHIATIELPPSP